MNEEPDFQITGAGKYRFVTLTHKGREVTERLPLHFFKLDPERQADMAREICKVLRRKIGMGVVK